ncbi:MAG: stage V sporulation protein AC [bacterium]
MDEQKEYEELTKRIKPKRPVIRNVIWAFIIGGLICVIAQLFFNLCEGMGLDLKDATGASVAFMIFLGAILTGFGVYDDLGDFSGAGSAVPITGFANSVVSPALEFKSEGYILGLGAKIFTVAGPVIAYGSITAVILAWITALIKG